ncbi:Hsp20/alpha crystallin family protein [Stratiformator vulcanicus]|uniref:Acid shock protein n=1 Tax=Stratiformator vulcanicus TaxID=2527980 RepID=A0A517R310_9PLAN|nr:Hsp20/alpha crystallin family protein [Stratiformator vulcanicus]QDT38269.1 Acid shock protein [Stratiformator vulcanicus]
MPVFRLHHNLGSLRDLEQEVDRLLRNVQLTVHGVRARRKFPAINVYEVDNEYLLTAELPGTQLSDLELTVANGMLTLRGKRADLDHVSESSFRRSERFHGGWERSVPLPERVIEDKLAATFANGVLKIRLPKAVQSPARKIQINADQENPDATESRIDSGSDVSSEVIRPNE